MSSEINTIQLTPEQLKILDEIIVKQTAELDIVIEESKKYTKNVFSSNIHLKTD